MTDGTTLPGFTESVDYVGQNFARNTPGLPFIFGAQNEDFRNNIAANGFLTTDTNQIARFINLSGVDINGSATLEPIKGFRISVNFNRRQSLNVNSNFRYQESSAGFEDVIYTEIGTFSTSFGSWSTMFDKLEDDYSSEAFTQFKNNRFTVAQRLQARDFGSGGIYEALYGSELNEIDTVTNFPVGYNNKHQEVLLHSFITAYSGKNAGTAELTPFKKIPIPNWRVTYNGLSKLDMFKDIFSNISISHGYSSTLNIGSFQRPLEYGTDLLDSGANLATQYQFQSGVTIVERLTPLLGIDVTTKEGITAKFEYKTDRNLQLNVITARMAIVRTLEGNNGEDSYIPTAGIRTMSIRPSIDYKISDALNFRMFYNRNSNNPVTSNSFPSALTDFGVTLRYTLQ